MKVLVLKMIVKMKLVIVLNNKYKLLFIEILVVKIYQMKIKKIRLKKKVKYQVTNNQINPIKISLKFKLKML